MHWWCWQWYVRCASAEMGVANNWMARPWTYGSPPAVLRGQWQVSGESWTTLIDPRRSRKLYSYVSDCNPKYARQALTCICALVVVAWAVSLCLGGDDRQAVYCNAPPSNRYSTPRLGCHLCGYEPDGGCWAPVLACIDAAMPACARVLAADGWRLLHRYGIYCRRRISLQCDSVSMRFYTRPLSYISY